MTAEPTEPVEIFYSYAHEDERLRKQLENHLSSLKQEGLITGWYDRDIRAGAKWASEIEAHLNSARIILLLVSPAFMASDYCMSVEVKRALERDEAGEAHVIPIILRHIDWERSPIGKLQALPKDAKPVTDWPNRDRAFVDIVKGIRKAISELPPTSSATSASPSQLWNIPYRRNPFFTGREDILTTLHNHLQTGKPAALTQPQAISGLGGIGKTQTAIEYAYRHRDEYHPILWARAATRESLIADYVNIAGLLNLREKNVQDSSIAVAAVKRWLANHKDWLLILDNADDLEMASDFLPTEYTGHILLTTRAQFTGTIANGIDLEKMDLAEGSLLLLRRASVLAQDTPLDQANSEDRATAEAIVKALDGLPLALDQAGAYIEETSCSLNGYLELYRTRRSELLKRRSRLRTDHPEPVATTWSLSFQQVEQANPAAADLLRLCAFLDPDAIPEEIITKGASELGPVLGPVAGDSFKLNAAIEELRRFSLIKRNPGAKLLNIHRLVQAVLKDNMNKEMQETWAERTVRAVNRVFPEWKVSNRLLSRRLFPQAQACFELIAQWDMMFPEAASLLHRAARYLRNSPKQYRKAESFDQQALKIQEKVLGKEHVDVTQILFGLALTYSGLNKYERAESIFRRVIAIDEQVFGPQAPETLNVQHALGYTYYKQGKYEEAASLYQQCLAIREQAPDANDKVATSTNLNNLALVYAQQEKYGEAEALYKRALEIRERVSGKQSVNVAITLKNMAGLYKKQGKYEQAEPLYQQALAIFLEKYEMEDRYTARCLEGLADLYCRQGEYKKAAPLYQQALSIWKEFLGLDHLEAAEVLEGYAGLLRKMRRTAEAAQLEARAKAIRAKSSS